MGQIILIGPNREEKRSKEHFIPRGNCTESGMLTACIGVYLFGLETGNGYGRHFFPNEVRVELPGMLEKAKRQIGDFEIFVAGGSVNYVVACLLGLTDRLKIDSTRQINNEIKGDTERIVDARVQRERTFINWLPEDMHARLYGNSEVMNLRVCKDVTMEPVFDGPAKKSPYLRR